MTMEINNRITNIIKKINAEIPIKIAFADVYNELLKVSTILEGVDLEYREVRRIMDECPSLNILLTYAPEDGYEARIVFIANNMPLEVYSSLFPDFYAFFPEYTSDEVDDAISRLSDKAKSMLGNMINKIIKEKKLEIEKRRELIVIIRDIYLKLIEIYGRRRFADLNVINSKEK